MKRYHGTIRYCQYVVLLLVVSFCLSCSKGDKIRFIDIVGEPDLTFLPHVAYSTKEDIYMVSFFRRPNINDMNNSSIAYAQRISSSGVLLGERNKIISSNYKLSFLRILYENISDNFLTANIMHHDRGISDVYATVINDKGQIKFGPNKISPGNNLNLHPSAAYNPEKRQTLIIYSKLVPMNGFDLFGIILNEEGTVIEEEFLINKALGMQTYPHASYNPANKTYLVTWEDFRDYNDPLKDPSNIVGALLDSNGKPIINDIPIAVDTWQECEGDQRYNFVVYNPDRNEYLVTWSVKGSSFNNVAIEGRIVDAGGGFRGEPFTIVDGVGAQMMASFTYIPERKMYFGAWENNRKELGMGSRMWFSEIDREILDLDIYGGVFDSTGKILGSELAIRVGSGNQRAAAIAYSSASRAVFVAWLEDTGPPVDNGDGHDTSHGGNIRGALIELNSILRR